jgi:hypothetical protein
MNFLFGQCPECKTLLNISSYIAHCPNCYLTLKKRVGRESETESFNFSKKELFALRLFGACHGKIIRVYAKLLDIPFSNYCKY